VPAAHPLADGLRPGGRFDRWQPLPPRYLVADVDGTLIGEVQTATERVVAAVRTAHSAGIVVGFATGRLASGVAALHDQLGLDGPHIVLNGAQVRTGGRALRTWSLRPAQSVAVRDLCARHGLYGEFYLDDGFLVTDVADERVRAHWELVTGPPAGLVDDVDLAATTVVKATIMAFSPDEASFVVSEVTRLGLLAGPATFPLTPAIVYVNVTHPRADKGRALAHAAGHLGCRMSEVIAVGDGLNDLSMLAVAGTAIAMGQAPAEVQQAAHLIVPDVAADGVAHALQAAAGWRRAA